MKELTNKKTKIAYLVSDDELQSIMDNGLLGRFKVTDVEPIQKLIPTPKIVNPEIKKTTNK